MLLIVWLVFLFQAFGDDRDESKTLYEEGKIKYEAGNIDEAITDLEMALNLDERNFKAKKLLVDVLSDKGKALVSEGRFDEALDVFTMAYKLWPNNEEVKEMYKGLKDGSVQEAYEKKINEASKIETKEMVTKIEEAKDTLSEVIETKASSDGEASEVEKALQKELEEQKKLLEKMKLDYEKKSGTEKETASANEMEALQELVSMYKAMIEEKDAAKEDPGYIALLLDEMRDYRTRLEKQAISPANLVFIAVGSFFGAIVFILVVLYIILRVISKRRRLARQRYAEERGYYRIPGSTDTFDTLEQQKNALLLGYDGEVAEPEIEKLAEADEDEMYKDLINYERLKRMHTQMKKGNLQWSTLRENMDLLQTELKTEILKLVEMKIEGGSEMMNYTSILPVIFPFLTSGDDYLRKKAHVIAYKLLESEKAGHEEEQKTNAMEKDEAIVSKENIDFFDMKTLTAAAENLGNREGRTGHSLNVANYARRIGLILGFGQDDLDLLYTSGLVHDFGFFLYSDEFLKKIRTQESLSEEDYLKLIQHPENGILYFRQKGIELPQKVSDGILFHHERLDGTGYPKGCRGEDIPEFGRIIAVADTFEALTSDRPNREKMTISSAAIVMRDLGRKKYDGKYIDAIIEFFKKI
ncbi:MAG: HD domain-containing protein [Spirochaetales bacterium]|nr:HD domain-containing protein [Spirochaetales bacterium]